jgi:predicted aspartyl protease
MLSRTFLPTRLALGFLAICGARADESGYVRINLLRSWQNHMTAPARLNGHNAKLIVDTGAFCSCLDPASVRSFAT